MVSSRREEEKRKGLLGSESLEEDGCGGGPRWCDASVDGRQLSGSSQAGDQEEGKRVHSTLLVVRCRFPPEIGAALVGELRLLFEWEVLLRRCSTKLRTGKRSALEIKQESSARQGKEGWKGKGRRERNEAYVSEGRTAVRDRCRDCGNWRSVAFAVKKVAGLFCCQRASFEQRREKGAWWKRTDAFFTRRWKPFCSKTYCELPWGLRGREV
jgi:hypothetical protein